MASNKRRQATAALGAGTIGGFVGLQIGFIFALCLGPFIGGLIGEAVLRATGYKRGPWMIRCVRRTNTDASPAVDTTAGPESEGV